MTTLMNRFACILGCHSWRVEKAPPQDPDLDMGYPVRTPLVCRRCGIGSRCGLCGRRH